MEDTPKTRKSPLPVKPVRPAYQQVADKIRDGIVEGRLTPGERLPVESELTELFGVSRSTVREALRSLSSQHLVFTNRGVRGGTFVAYPDADNITRYLEASLSMLSSVEKVTVAELVEARRLLEVPACRLTAEHATREVLARLRACVGDPSAIAGPSNFEGHREFHQAILKASGNGLLELMTYPIFTVLRNRFARQEASRDFWVAVEQDHVDILRAIESGDPDGAAAAMEAHLVRLGSMYVEIDRATRENDEA
jgi:GntR family transcriptional regulator, transcriptional repressor for pyruvate dehydrogenase complex